MELPPDFESRYRSRRYREIEESHVVATALGLLVFPAFAALDFFDSHDRLSALLIVRAIMTAIFGLAYLLARRGIRPGGVTATATSLLLFSAAGISVMCGLTGGFASPYYAGINLLILTCVNFPPGTFRQTVGACAGIVAIYLLGVSAMESRPFAEIPFLVNNLLFIGATCAIGFATAFFHENLRREAFLRLIEAEDADAVRKAHAAVIRAIGIRDEFISIASHELRTPITSMKLQNDLVRREIAAKSAEKFLTEAGAYDRLRRWVARNDGQLRRLNRLVEDMLDIARIHTGRLTFSRERVDLGEIARETVERFAPQFQQAGMTISLRAPPGIVGVGDHFRIEQVLANFLSNAVKYASGKPLEILIEAQGGEGFVRVRDHGPGVPLGDRERIFDRFERAHSAEGATGLGLGLYIAKKIAEGHGGRIWVEETPGGGSTFVFRLPAVSLESYRSGRGPTAASSNSIESGSAP